MNPHKDKFCFRIIGKHPIILTKRLRWDKIIFYKHKRNNSVWEYLRYERRKSVLVEQMINSESLKLSRYKNTKIRKSL